ncbi:MAG: substrate-binding domain-containing protein [Clostridium sp.]|nr:substrate-binding domain-containing protein [Clostridium sp.]
MHRKVTSALLTVLLVAAVGFTCACGAKSTAGADSAAETGAETSTENGNIENTETEADAEKSADFFDVSNYKSQKEQSQWTIGVVYKDATAAWGKRIVEGVEEFHEETGINLIVRGPATADAASQVQVVDDLIAQGIDALCVIPIDPGALESSLEKAMEKGIVVVTHEGGSQKNTLFDIEACTAEAFGTALMDALAEDMGERGKYGISVGYVTTASHMEYAKVAAERQAAAYPDMELINGGAVPSMESEESVNTAYEHAKELIKTNPDLKGFIGIASTDAPGVSQAVEELGLEGQVKIIGVGTPNEYSPYLKSGAVSRILTWDPGATGYAMCALAAQILAGEVTGNGEGLDIGVDGYNSMILEEGANRCLIGAADLSITGDDVDGYGF